MPFKKCQRVRFQYLDSYNGDAFTGVIVHRYLRRGFVEILVLTRNGDTLKQPFMHCDYPDQMNLEPLED